MDQFTNAYLAGLHAGIQKTASWDDLVASASNFYKNNPGLTLGTGAGLTYGAASGALSPGIDGEGEPRSRISEALKRALGYGAAGAAGGATFDYLRSGEGEGAGGNAEEGPSKIDKVDGGRGGSAKNEPQGKSESRVLPSSPLSGPGPVDVGEIPGGPRGPSMEDEAEFLKLQAAAEAAEADRSRGAKIVNAPSARRSLWGEGGSVKHPNS